MRKSMRCCCSDSYCKQDYASTSRSEIIDFQCEPMGYLAVAALRVSEGIVAIRSVASSILRLSGLHARISVVFPESATCLVCLPDQVGYSCCAATIEPPRQHLCSGILDSNPRAARWTALDCLINEPNPLPSFMAPLFLGRESR